MVSLYSQVGFMSVSESEEETRSSPLVWSVILLHMLNHVISGAMPMLYPGHYGRVQPFLLPARAHKIGHNLRSWVPPDVRGFPETLVQRQGPRRNREPRQLGDEHFGRFEPWLPPVLRLHRFRRRR